MSICKCIVLIDTRSDWAGTSVFIPAARQIIRQTVARLFQRLTTPFPAGRVKSLSYPLLLATSIHDSSCVLPIRPIHSQTYVLLHSWGTSQYTRCPVSVLACLANGCVTDGAYTFPRVFASHAPILHCANYDYILSNSRQPLALATLFTALHFVHSVFYGSQKI